MFTVVNLAGPISPFTLGQEEAAPEPIEVDRVLAETTRNAIASIEKAAAEDKGVTLEPCWRVLRVAKWPKIVSLRNRLVAFLATNNQTLVISEPEFNLMDEVLACSVNLERGEQASLKSTLEIAGIVVGIAGGIAALVAAVF